MAPNLKINAAAFISPQNQPILIQTFVKSDDDLKYHYMAHTSLDVIEERGQHEPYINFIELTQRAAQWLLQGKTPIVF